MPDGSVALHPQIQYLVAMVQEDFGDWGNKRVVARQRRINRFAKATGDDQWLHTDRKKAKKRGPFETTVAQGMLVESLVATLLKKELTKFQQAGLGTVMYAGRESEVVYRVLRGDGLRARCRVSEVKPKPRTARVSVAYEIQNEENKIVARGTLKFNCIAR